MDNLYEELVNAIRAGDTAKVTELLAANLDLDTMESPLKVSFFMMALYSGKPDVARVFLKKGHAMNFHEAAAWGDARKISLLLQQDATLLDAFSIDGFQALGLACFFDHEKVVEELLKAGASVNDPSRNFQQVTPLHSAAAADSMLICRMLLEHGAEVNVIQQGGFTPLHAAVQNGNVQVVQLFLQSGAKVNTRNLQGMTALTMAKESKNEEVISVLLAAGGVE